MQIEEARFNVTFVAAPGTDGIRALRAVLKVALRRFGLRAIDAREQVSLDEQAVDEFRGLTSPSHPHGA
jgi:hypothetical protein